MIIRVIKWQEFCLLRNIYLKVTSSHRFIVLFSKLHKQAASFSPGPTILSRRRISSFHPHYINSSNEVSKCNSKRNKNQAWHPFDGTLSAALGFLGQQWKEVAFPTHSQTTYVNRRPMQEGKQSRSVSRPCSGHRCIIPPVSGPNFIILPCPIITVYGLGDCGHLLRLY